MRRNPIEPIANPAPMMPRPLSGFVGRKREIAALSALLTSPAVRLLTITGPGGIGKTRLALETAATLNEAFPDGIAFVPLAPTGDPERVPFVIARVLLRDARASQDLNRLHEALAGKNFLLLLDNLEHLLSAGPLLADLLQTHPRLTVLATSRSRLDLSGEHVFGLGPLSRDDARTLFRQRARALNAHTTFHDGAVTIDAICSRLDYLPLAIELAAARTATLPPDALLSRLSQPLTILRNGPRDVPLRHQTMRDTIAWSYDLLDDDRRAGFRQLSVFVGGFTLEGAQAILGNDSDALDLVEFLVARSLVVPMPGESSAPRFAMLESIRQFGVDELVASGDDEATRRAQADYLIALAENAIPFYDGPHLYFYLSRVVDEMDNIRSAMRWSLDCRDGIRANRLAGAIWRLWQNGEMRWLANTPWEAHWAEGRSWLEQALALRESVPPAFQLEALSGMTYLLVTTGQHHQADRYAEELLDRAREAQDPLGEHWAHLAKADNARSRGDLLTARTEFAAALEAAQRSRDPDNQTCGAYVGLGRLELATGNLPEAEANLRTALTFGGISGNPHNLSLATVFLAIVCHQQGKADEAAQFALAGIRHLADIHDDARSQIPVLILAELALTTGQTLEAVRLVAHASTRPRFYGSTTIDEAKIAPFRAALPEPAFSQEWEAGTRLSPEDIRVMAERIVEILDRDPSPPPTLIPTSLLSPREEEVLHLLVAGRTNRAIGQELFISERTVEKHVLHIMTKLDLDSRTGIVAWAVRNGVVA